MLIIFTGEKDEKINRQIKPVCGEKKKRKKKSPEYRGARLLSSILYLRK